MSDAAETTTEVVKETTEYPAVEIIQRTPEEAAREVFSPPASSIDRRGTGTPMSNVSATDVRERYVEGSGLVEVVNDEEQEGLPIALSGDDSYQAVVAQSDIDFNATRNEEEVDVKK